MRVLVADVLPSSSLSELRTRGHHVRVARVRGKALAEALGAFRPEVLVVRSTRVDHAALNACTSLALVVRAGAGYDTIDLAAASAAGIFVANCPGKNAHAVAELAVGLIIAADRRIPDGVQTAREGRWDKAAFAKARGLCQRTLAIIGLGSIGRLVAQAAQGLGMHVVAWSRSLTTEQAASLGITRAPTPEDAASVSDVVSIHVASNAHTRHLAGREFFEAMRPGAIFVNTARSEVVDENALAWAVKAKGLRVAVDVCHGEPRYKKGAFEWTLAQSDNVYVTHHIGASTMQAQEATGAETVRVIRSYAEQGIVPNCVNMQQQSAATHLLTVRHKDRIGVLASILDVIRRNELNVQEMENLVFAGKEAAACARIRLDGAPDDSLTRQLEALRHVVAASLISL